MIICTVYTLKWKDKNVHLISYYCHYLLFIYSDGDFKNVLCNLIFVISVLNSLKIWIDSDDGLY